MCGMFLELLLLIVTMYAFIIVLSCFLQKDENEIVKILMVFTSFWLLMVTISKVAVFVFYLITLFYA